MARQERRVQPQLGMDEVVVDNAEAEAALEARLVAKLAAGEATKVYKTAHETAAGLVNPLIEQADVPTRIGRFRITRVATKAREVSFSTSPGTRLRIEADGGDEE